MLFLGFLVECNRAFPREHNETTESAREELTTKAPMDPYGDDMEDDKLFFLVLIVCCYIISRCIASKFEAYRPPRQKETVIFV